MKIMAADMLFQSLVQKLVEAAQICNKRMFGWKNMILVTRSRLPLVDMRHHMMLWNGQTGIHLPLNQYQAGILIIDERT